MKIFPEQRKGEKTYLLEHKHPFLMIKPVLILLVALIILFFLLRITRFTINSFYVLIFFIIIFGLYGFWAWSSWQKTLYILTNLRALVIQQKGFFSKEVAEAPLDNIRDIRWKRIGFWATLFNFGEVKIKVLGGISAIHWPGIAKPNLIQEKIQEAIEDIESPKSKAQMSNEF